MHCGSKRADAHGPAGCSVICIITTDAASSGEVASRPPRRVVWLLCAGHAVVMMPPGWQLQVAHWQTLPVSPQDIPLDVIYEDAHVLVVNKAAGMVVHPSPGHPTGTLVNAVLHHCKLPAMRLLPGQQAPASLDADWGAGVSPSCCTFAAYSSPRLNSTCCLCHLRFGSG